MSLRKTPEELRLAMEAATDPVTAAEDELRLIFNNVEVRKWLVEQGSFPATRVLQVLGALYKQGERDGWHEGARDADAGQAWSEDH